MAAAAHDALADRLHAGVIVSPDAVGIPAPWRTIVAEHPRPGDGSIAAGHAALALAAATQPVDLLLVLLSGGASSLMAAPAPGLTLDDKRRATTLLLRGGADIHALNTVRKHISAVKGGRLAAAAAARCLTLVISDVVGDDPSVIASGPTVPDASTFEDALRVLDDCGGRAAFPPPLVAHLERGVRGQVEETPKPGDPRLSRAEVRVIGSRPMAMAGAANEARRRGYHTVIIDEPVVGEARDAAPQLFRCALALAAAGPCCIVAGGETTVTVAGTGVGGRNQECALALVELMAGLGRPAAFASAGTDGIDGPTDAAGAIATSTTWARGRDAGLEPAAFLAANNSYEFFAALGDLVKTGPTGTNVGDLQVFLLG
jgi:glycerate-2-kinase